MRFFEESKRPETRKFEIGYSDRTSGIGETNEGELERRIEASFQNRYSNHRDHLYKYRERGSNTKLLGIIAMVSLVFYLVLKSQTISTAVEKIYHFTTK